MPTQYTPEQRAEALELYIEYGSAVASRETGVPDSLIRLWAHRSGDTTRRQDRVNQGMLAWAQRREVMAARFGDQAERFLDYLGEMDLSDLSPKDAAKILTALTDKAQILTGGRTGAETTVNVNLTGWSKDDL